LWVATVRIRQSSYPHAESFAANIVLKAPTEAQALEFLSQLEAMPAER
jgi:hypothetical protein